MKEMSQDALRNMLDSQESLTLEDIWLLSGLYGTSLAHDLGIVPGDKDRYELFKIEKKHFGEMLVIFNSVMQDEDPTDIMRNDYKMAVDESLKEATNLNQKEKNILRETLTVTYIYTGGSSKKDSIVLSSAVPKRSFFSNRQAKANEWWRLTVKSILSQYTKVRHKTPLESDFTMIFLSRLIVNHFKKYYPDIYGPNQNESVNDYYYRILKDLIPDDRRSGFEQFLN